MPSQYLRYERIAVDTVNRLYELIDKADTDPQRLEYLALAATTGCNALQRFTRDGDFFDDLVVPYRKLAENPLRQLIPDWKPIDPARAWAELRDDMDEFNRFLTIEREVLVKGGMEPGAADLLIFECRGISAQRQSEEEVLHALERLQGATCDEANRLRMEIANALANAESRQRAKGTLRRVILVTGGVALVGASVGAAVVTFGLSTPASVVLGTIGGGLIVAGAG